MRLMEGNEAIRAEGLDKRFGDIHALNNVSFTVERGAIFSLLGPNGAGKSTTIAMLSCLLRPSSGDATVMGHSITSDPQGVKASIGVVPQEIALYEDLTALENLTFWGKMYRLSGGLLQRRIDEVLAIIGLTDRARDRVETFSGGMKRRVNIGVALLHRPDVIIMDEPTVGIDPQSRRHILDSVKGLNREGATVLYTTHYMEEAQELSDCIAIMDRGEIIACGTHDELIQIVGEKDRVELSLNGPAGPVLGHWQEMAGVEQVTARDGIAMLLVDDSNMLLPHLFETATANGLHITSVNIQEPNLETVFLQLTGRALRD